MTDKMWCRAKTVVKSIVTNKYLMLILIVAVLLRCLIITNYIGSSRETSAFNGDEVIDLNAILQMGNNHTLNPHEFHYPSLYYYVCAIFILPVCTFSGEWAVSLLLARSISLFFGVLSIIATFFVGREIYDNRTGLLAAAFLALVPVDISLSCQAKPDTMQLFFVIMSIFYCIKIVKTQKTSNYYMACIFAGLAFTTKYIGLFLIPIVILAYFLTFETREKSFLRNTALIIKKGFTNRVGVNKILFLIIALIIPILLGTPCILLSPLEFLLGLARSSYVSGHGTWMGRENPLSWFSGFAYGLGIVLSLLSLVGIILSLYLVRYIFKSKEVKMRTIPLAWAVFYFLLLFFTSGRTSVHYMLPVIPFLLIFASGLFYTVNKNLKVPSLVSKKALTAGIILIVLISTSIFASSIVLPYTLQSNHDTRYAAAKWMENNVPRNATIFYDVDIYIPEKYQNAVLNDYEPPVTTEIYNNTYSDYDQLVITADWQWFYTPPLEFVNKSKPEYIFVSSGMYQRCLNNSNTPHLAEFYERLFNGSLNYTKIKEFSSIDIYQNPYDFGIEALIDMWNNPSATWTGPRIIVFKRGSNEI